ncbi:MAG: NAD(P)-dependent oxidoreductase [bacterium]|nr:NAD(P)-dependent oxidoreductase [bacterium]
MVSLSGAYHSSAEFEMNNILVVGGAGYVGGAITDELLQRGTANFRVFDNLLYEETYRKDVEFIFGDIRDAEQLLPHLAWATHVIWLAAIVGDGACTLDPQLTVKINQECVSWLAAHFDGRVLFTSTCSVYGAQPGELTEESPLKPLSLYAGTKLKAESFLGEKNGVTFRLGTLFGIGDLFSRIRMDLVVNYMTAHAHAHGKLRVFGGDQFRPLLHVKDVAHAIVDALDRSQTGLFNLVKQNTRMIDLAYQIRNHYPDIEVEKTEAPFEDTRNYRVSAEKAKTLLGFRPAHSIDDGIEELKHLMETRKIKEWSSARYSNHQFLEQLLVKQTALSPIRL